MMDVWLVPTSAAVVITLVVLIVKFARWAGSVNTSIETLKDVTVELRSDMKDLATEFRTEMREFRTEMREFRADLRDVRTEMNDLATEFRTEMKELATEFRTEMREFRTEMREFRTELTEIRTEMSEVRTEIRTEMSAVRMEISEVRTEIRTEMSEVRMEISEVRGDNQGIRTNLYAVMQNLSLPVTMTESPVKLTEYGESIAQEFDAPTWAITAAEQLRLSTEGMPEWKLYEQCVQFVQDQMNIEATADRMKEVAYNKGIEVAKVHTVLSVVLRDRLLALRAEDTAVESAPAGES
ncbi:MAG: hypothetical protein OXM02_10855 [Bacteroidota bacterium]|nr:hypothetical protein [Bacteroidota bacterium]MDE2835002.1 hypothetical protein [Bacteroidota bacterium]